MANTTSAAKRARQSVKRTLRNRSVVTGLRTMQKGARSAQVNALCISHRPDRFCRMIPALLLVLSAVVYRVTTGLLIHSGASWLSNFAPLAAIALCSAAYFPKKYKFSVPLVTLFISDVVINFRYGAPLLDPQILVRYAA